MRSNKSKLAKEYIRENIFKDKKEIVITASEMFSLSKSTISAIIHLVQSEIKEELVEVKKELIEKLKNENKGDKRNKFLFDDSALWK